MTPTIAKLQGIGDATFTVKGYQRSDGAVVNLTVKFLPHDGYKGLARASVKCIDDFGELLDKTHYEVTRDTVLASLQKSLAEPSEDASPVKRQSNETLEFLARNIAILDGNPDKVVLFNMETITEEVLVQPAKVVKSRDELSANKKKLMAALPVGRFCYRLNLYPGKYEMVD